jgi:hypothetical protein
MLATIVNADEKKKKEPRNRLHEILVHEVSLVDHPANKRRFLVVKRSSSMAAELDDDQKKDQADKKADLADDKTAKSDPKKQEGDNGKDDDKKKPPFPPVKPELADAMKRLIEAAGKAKTSGKMSPELAKEIKDISQALDTALKAPAKTAKADDKPKQTVAVDALKDVGADDATLTAIGKLLERGGTSIEKAGARMAKERLARFRKAMDLLQSLLKEFLPEVQATKSQASEAGLLAMDPAFVAAFKKQVSSNNNSSEIVEKIKELGELVAKQNERIDKISKSTGSNQLPVGNQSQPVDQEVVWPLDMNRPITRETVDKSVSFFDVD